ncbi:MAG TPA: hypothetical protein VFA44_04625 [Gaiellaceae bacterium]|nr:hypothetical protein [Gaiellaceae bacterium]
MSSRTCPDWPQLMEQAPELQFKHYTVRELSFPADVLVAIGDAPLDEVNVCCDAEHNVYNPGHTDPRVAEALRGSHWFDLREWTTSGPGAAGSY